MFSNSGDMHQLLADLDTVRSARWLSRSQRRQIDDLASKTLFDVTETLLENHFFGRRS